jgi:hypothetical protein
MKKLALLLLVGCSTAPAPPAGPAVIIVSTDGLRWQELFTGADPALIDRKDADLVRDFWRETPEARREALFPFLWTVVAKQGQLYGNALKGSHALCSNGRNFSYPGYQELLCGFPDPRIDSNAKKPNPNVSVLEWLSKRPGFEERVAAFGTWDVLPFILNRPRSGLPTQAAHEPIRDEPLTERQRALNDLLRDTTDPWGGNPMDSFTHHAAVEHWKRHAPRALYILYGETDEWAHEGRYGLYLRAAHRFDRFLRELWELAQQRGDTSLVITTDHGRGVEAQWTNHSTDTFGAQQMWIALLGPRVKPLGELANVLTVRQAQVAATAAALAGEVYAGPRIFPPLPLNGDWPSRHAVSSGPAVDWNFATGLPPGLTVHGAPTVAGGHVALDGSSHLVVDAPPSASRGFTLSARVAIEARQEWGGIVGRLQDNGSEEQGWILGFDNERFYVGLASKGAADDDGFIVYLRGGRYRLGEWHDVEADYDGDLLILRVDGVETARSAAQWGEVFEPRTATFAIGAYVDRDETHAMKGRISSIRFKSR